MLKSLPLFAALCAASVAWCAKPNVIPALREWTDGIGGTYALSEKTRVIIAEDADAQLEQFAQTFAQDIGRELVRETPWYKCIIPFWGDRFRMGDIYLKVRSDSGVDNPEGYTITSAQTGLVVEAPTAQGAFWGTRSILQVFAAQGNTFPAGKAKDWPEYKGRGFMFDCGRKPFTMTTLRQLVKICSYYKLNDLQLHLSDNYIWLHNYPGVKTAQDILAFEPSAGAFRLESQVPGLTATDISYTKADFRALVAEAAAQGVTITPELDVPGHALALVRVRPDLMYKGSVGGKHDLERAAMLDLTNPETLPFVQSIFDEYIDAGIFSSETVHIGTDEYYGDAESYRAFADAMLKHIRAKGKTPRLWGSLSYKRGQTPVTSEGVQMHIWSLGWQNPREAIAAGYDIINILDVWTYSVPSGNGSVGGYGDDINSKSIYENWSPANFNNLSVDPKEPKLLGGAWAMWNDNSFRTDPGLCGRDLLPRIQKNCAAIGAKCWDGAKPERPYDDFLAQVKAQAKTLDAEEPGEWELSFNVLVPEGSTCFPLAKSDETDLYAVSPVNGKVGFRREGAQYTFDVTLPKGKPTKVTFRSKKRETSLLIDDQPFDGKPVRQYFPEACKFYTLPKPQAN